MHSALLLLVWLGCTPPERGPATRVGDDAAWYLTFGGSALDEAWGVDLTDDGDVFVSTHQADPSLSQGFVYRLSGVGAVEWEAEWGEAWSEQLFAVDEVDGVVYVAGTRFTSLDLWDTEALLLRFDAGTGALLEPVWRHDDPDAWNEIDGIVATSDAVYLSGWGESRDGDLLMVQLDLDGNEQEVVDWGSEGWDEANGQMVAVDDRVFVAGRLGADSVTSGGDGVAVAFDTPGLAESWHTTWGEAGTLEDLLGMATDGRQLYAVGIQAADAGIVVVAFDLDGRLVWEASWDGGGGEVGRAIRIDPTDGSVVAAVNSDASGHNDIVFLRFDAATGALTEEQSWGGDDDDEVHDFVLDANGGFLVGQTESVGKGNYDAIVARFGMRPWDFPEL